MSTGTNAKQCLASRQVMVEHGSRSELCQDWQCLVSSPALRGLVFALAAALRVHATSLDGHFAESQVGNGLLPGAGPVRTVVTSITEPLQCWWLTYVMPGLARCGCS